MLEKKCLASATATLQKNSEKNHTLSQCSV